MFSFFKKLFGFKTAQPAKPRLELPRPGGASSSGRPPAKPAEKPGPGASPKAKEEWAKQAAQKINPGATPEQLCNIEPGMTPEQISAQLAMLYRRHNRAASSLEANLREEAEVMLDVIAAMKQKYLQ
jgi:hypothetical protein